MENIEKDQQFPIKATKKIFEKNRSNITSA